MLKNKWFNVIFYNDKSVKSENLTNYGNQYNMKNFLKLQDIWTFDFRKIQVCEKNYQVLDRSIGSNFVHLRNNTRLLPQRLSPVLESVIMEN